MVGLLDGALGPYCAGSSDTIAMPQDPPRWLDDPRIAAIVRDSMICFRNIRSREHRYCIMSNHVHWLIEPLPRAGSVPGCPLTYWPLSLILKSLKSYTSRKCNAVVGRQGAFWQEEGFDHRVRNLDEYQRIIESIDQNPVKAGLCESPEQWLRSSAGESRRN